MKEISYKSIDFVMFFKKSLHKFNVIFLGKKKIETNELILW